MVVSRVLPSLSHELVLLEQSTQVQGCSFIGQTDVGERQARKLALGMILVERFRHDLITQFKPLLHEVSPQHGVERVGRMPVFTFGIRRAGQRKQAIAGGDLLHLGQKLLAVCLLAPDTELQNGKSRLGHSKKVQKVGKSFWTIRLFEGSMNTRTFSES